VASGQQGGRGKEDPKFFVIIPVHRSEYFKMSTRNKECKECKFTGKVNAEEKCRSCVEKERYAWCRGCGLEVRDNDQGLNCDICQQWLHAQCEKVGAGLYRELQEAEKLAWGCTKCITQAKRHPDIVRKMREEKVELEKEQVRLDEEVKRLRECLGVVERENRSLREKIGDLEKGKAWEAKVDERAAVGSTGEANGPAGAAGLEGDEEARGPRGLMRTVRPAHTKKGETGSTAGPRKDETVVRHTPQDRQDPEVAVVAEVRGAGAVAAKEGTAEATPTPREAPSVKARWPIVCVGDSMVKYVNRHIVMRGERSKLVSLSGKGIGEVAQAAKESMRGLEKGMLILQGGGNGLRQLGPEQTVKKIMECVREVKREKKVRVAVVGVLGRPKESRGYEELRRETNRLLQQEVLNLKLECNKREGDYGVSFLDLDGALPPAMYGRDGVHLSKEGDRIMCKRFLEWVNATERLRRMRESKGGSTRE